MRRSTLKQYLQNAVFLAWIIPFVSQAGSARIYYTYDPGANFVNIKERFVPADMTVQKFLDTFWPPLPGLDAYTQWALASKAGIRAQPWDLVAAPNNSAGKSAQNPWIVTRVRIG